MKVKKVIRGRDLFFMMEPLMDVLIKIVSILPYGVRKKIFFIFRMMNGLPGIGIRYVFFKSLVKVCGKNVAIHPGVYFFELKNLEVGDNVTFHPMCYVDASGGLKIGSDVSIAHGTTILTSSHNCSELTAAISDQGLNYAETVIESNVWIGAKATILSGVTIKSGVVAGANSLVNRTAECNTVVGGVPARIIKMRCDGMKKSDNHMIKKYTGGGISDRRRFPLGRRPHD